MKRVYNSECLKNLANKNITKLEIKSLLNKNLFFKLCGTFGFLRQHLEVSVFEKQFMSGKVQLLNITESIMINKHTSMPLIISRPIQNILQLLNHTSMLHRTPISERSHRIAPEVRSHSSTNWIKDSRSQQQKNCDSCYCKCRSNLLHNT